MKNTSFRACLFAAALFASMATASAADTIKGTPITGGPQVAYGVHDVLSVEVGSYSGQPTVKLRRAGGYLQELFDSPSNALHARVVQLMGSNAVAVANSPVRKVYNVSTAIVGCWSTGSYIAWSNVAQADYLTGDGCAFHMAVLQATP